MGLSVSSYTDDRKPWKFNKKRADLKSGDLLLFSGHGPFSWMVRCGTMSPWSHVGVVHRDPTTDELYIWHSTNESKIKDEITSEKKDGVQLNKLETYLKSYDGDIVIRSLNKRLPDPSPEFDWFLKHTNQGYENNDLEMVNAAFNGFCDPNYGSGNTYFCSEAVPLYYIERGILDKDKIGNICTLTPYHYTSFGEEFIKFKSGYYFEKERLLKIKKK